MEQRQADYDRDPHRTPPLSPSAVCPKNHSKTPNWPECNEKDIFLLSVDQKLSNLWTSRGQTTGQTRDTLTLFFFLVVNKTNTTRLLSSITSQDTRRINRLCRIYKSPDTRRYSGACSGQLSVCESLKPAKIGVETSRKAARSLLKQLFYTQVDNLKLFHVG